MTFKTKAIRMTFLLSAAAVLAAIGAASHWNLAQLERELAPIAQANIEELERTLLPTLFGDYRIVGTELTAARTHGIVGEPKGKISVYVARKTRSGQEFYYAYDYFYTRSGDAWRFSESGVCGDGESQERGLAFDAKRDGWL